MIRPAINKEREIGLFEGGVNRIFHVFLRRTTVLWAKMTRNKSDFLLEMRFPIPRDCLE